ncbi:MAG: hypothetical protein UW69_C0081G0005 [Microgenomates group bacterium GW2011_GWA2_44_7]|uniref:Uncharacterized protein n=1 Tax=Candidatus Gottesmanbacteria bacterium GW2011_GWA1_48_13 TaxID=1618439 RepID=A0A0G1UL81_9BACT|nr:MAG: hypothetical protein UW69_C0081G0005 [Microgenomates group bacterium GW2011_GWA2_44_7]KKU94947.1 MAG: hypothetical protein UY27_C0029G0005 [Candidatus Gottesmanbacteria bacterium GW2011_GWA1_48_13]
MSDDQSPTEGEPSTSRVVLGVVIALVVLGGLTYAAYLYSNRKSGAVFPAGYPQSKPAAKIPTISEIDCNTTDPAIKTSPNYYIKCDNYKEGPDTKWTTVKNPLKGTQFDFPEELKLLPYTNGYNFAWRTLPAAGGLVISHDASSLRSGNFKTMKGEEYPKNYWKQYNGLTGVKSVTPYTTKNSVSGWQAVYIYFGTDTPTLDTFFEDPAVPGDFMHFSKGVLSDEVYKKVMDSFKWTPKSTPAPTTAGKQSAPTTAPTVGSPSASPSL